MKFYSVAEVRANLAKILDSAQHEHERVVITRNGEPASVVLGVSDYEDLMDELEIYKDPKLLRRLLDGPSDEEKYLFYTMDDMQQLLAKRKAGHEFTDEELDQLDREVIDRNKKLK